MPPWNVEPLLSIGHRALGIEHCCTTFYCRRLSITRPELASDAIMPASPQDASRPRCASAIHARW
jgi:hypothetical protein